LEREVDMWIGLGASLVATKSYAAHEVGETYRRAQHLCQYLADPHQLFPVLRGLFGYYNVRAEYQMARRLGEQLLTLAEQSQDPALFVAAHRALGVTLFRLGAVATAHTHLTQGIARYTPQQHRASVFLYGDDSGVVCHSYASRTLWSLGYPDQGLAQSHEAVTLAQQRAHPFTLGFALSGAAIFHQHRREVRAAQEHAEATMPRAKAQGFPFWTATGALIRGWVRGQEGKAQEGIEQINQGLRAFRATGAEIARPYWLALLAEVHGTRG